MLTNITSAGSTVTTRLVAYLTVGILFPVLAMGLMMLRLCIIVLVALGWTVTKTVRMLKSGKKNLITLSLV